MLLGFVHERGQRLERRARRAGRAGGRPQRRPHPRRRRFDVDVDRALRVGARDVEDADRDAVGADPPARRRVPACRRVAKLARDRRSSPTRQASARAGRPPRRSPSRPPPCSRRSAIVQPPLREDRGGEQIEYLSRAAGGTKARRGPTRRCRARRPVGGSLGAERLHQIERASEPEKAFIATRSGPPRRCIRAGGRRRRRAHRGAVRARGRAVPSAVEQLRSRPAARGRRTGRAALRRSVRACDAARSARDPGVDGGRAWTATTSANHSRIIGTQRPRCARPLDRARAPRARLAVGRGCRGTRARHDVRGTVTFGDDAADR